MFAAVRLNPDGSLDQSFGHDGTAVVPIGSSSIANAVVIQPDESIVLAGTALVGHVAFAAARLGPNGSLDPTFGTNGVTVLGPIGGAWGMVLQQDGKLVLAGQTGLLDSVRPVTDLLGIPTVSLLQYGDRFMAARLNSDGTLDAGFGSAGIATIPVGVAALGFGVALEPDGKLVLGAPRTPTPVSTLPYG